MPKIPLPMDPLDPVDTEDVKKTWKNIKFTWGWIKKLNPFKKKVVKTASMVFILIWHVGCIGTCFKITGSLPIPDPNPTPRATPSSK